MQILNFFQQETKQKIDTKKLKISTINRILSNPESRSYLGIDIKNGNIISLASKAESLARLNKLFDKIMVDDVAVKEVYHTPDSIKFMKKLFIDKPKIASGRSINLATGFANPSSTKTLKSIPKTPSRNTLIPKGCILQIQETKINNIYHELKFIPIDTATNAVGVLFRVFLETSLDFYYSKKCGMAFGQNVKLAGKITKITDILEKRKFANSHQLKNIRSVTQKGNSILSIDNFHQYVHSFKTQPVPVDLIYKWDNLQEFFEILWA
ncbi:MAG: hypothetical protein AAB809_00800 [Patescibacteria group bacterium]